MFDSPVGALCIGTDPPSACQSADMSNSLRLSSYTDSFPKHRPYVLEAEQGETLAVVGGSTVRYLATREETSNAFGLVQSRGGPDERVLPQ